MLLEIFKSNKGVVGVVVMLVSVVLWVPGFFVSQEIIESARVLRFNDINLLFTPRWLNVIFSSLLIGAQGVFLNYIINKQKVLKASSFLIALFYVIINGAGLKLFSFHLILAANTFVLLMLYQLLSLYKLQKANATIFNLGFFIGILSILYVPFVVLFPLAIFVIAYVRTSNIKDYLVLLIGVLVPVAYWMVYLFLNDQLFNVEEEFVLFSPKANVINLQKGTLFLTVLGIVLLVAYVNFIITLSRSVVKIRKLKVVVSLLMLVCGATFLLNMNDYRTLYLIVAVPASIVLANLFANFKKRWIAELLFSILILSVIADYFL